MEDCSCQSDPTGPHRPPSILLELSATNDLIGFKRLIESEGYDVDEPGLWYGRIIGTRRFGFEERTPLMVASMFGSTDVVGYILETGRVDVNRACGSDGATALHCAAAGGAHGSEEVIKLLVGSSADVTIVDAGGNRPADVVAPRRKIPELLPESDEDDTFESPKSSSDGRREYPVDPSLPDIKNGVYGTDEFRMYTFKVKPCSRAYSHDWTECPFAHPGENARRRDPRRYGYSCVPCPEFRKGACPKGDACEYAHGIFECWLHPAQYRTRLCKDETGCARRVCFFAHKLDELRPLYPSTGSAVPSPRSYSPNPNSNPNPSNLFELQSLSPPMTPTGLQLPGSRLKAALCARDMDLEIQLRRQQILDELAGLSVSNPANLYGAIDPMMSPTGIQTRSSINHRVLTSYSSGLPSSPVRSGLDPSGPHSPRLAGFARRTQSFIERGLINRSTPTSPMTKSPLMTDWGSPDGKLDWGVQLDDVATFKRSSSFGLRTNGPTSGTVEPNEPDVSWVQTLVKDPQGPRPSHLGLDDELKRHYQLSSGGSERVPPWVEQMYMEQEPMAA